MTRLLVKPPPAPSALRYRDPTIEDALRAIQARVPGGANVWHWLPNDGHQPADVASEIMLAALNAIGAKVAEGEG